MHAHRTKLERDSSLKYQNGEAVDWDLNLGQFGENGEGEGWGLVLPALFSPLAPQC